MKKVPPVARPGQGSDPSRARAALRRSPKATPALNEAWQTKGGERDGNV
jgi:hypothetical protein